MQTAYPPRPIQAAPPPRAAADLFHQAKTLMRLFDVGGYERAADGFQRLLDAAPGHAAALAGLAETCSYWGFRRELSGQEFQSYYDRAYASAEEALRLAPGRADSHRSMSLALRGGDKRDPERAEREARAAVELDPNDAESWHQLWRAAGRGVADPSIHRALELDPTLCAAENDLGVALCEAGRLDEAVARFMAALRVNPRNSLVLYNLAMVLDRNGMREPAVAVMSKARAMHPGEPLLDYGCRLLA